MILLPSLAFHLMQHLNRKWVKTKGVKPFDFKSFDLGTYGSDITIRKSPINIHVAPQVDKNPRDNKHQKMIPVTGLFVTLTRSARSKI